MNILFLDGSIMTRQSIGFIGPGLALLCLNYARTPTTAAVFLTAALSLSSFSQAGFLLNMQVSCFTSKYTWQQSSPVTKTKIGHLAPFASGHRATMCRIPSRYALKIHPRHVCPVFFKNTNTRSRTDDAFLFAGISNSAGTLAAIISTIGTGFFVQWLGSFQAFLTLTACLYFASTIFWNLYATGERVF